MVAAETIERPRLVTTGDPAMTIARVTTTARVPMIDLATTRGRDMMIDLATTRSRDMMIGPATTGDRATATDQDTMIALLVKTTYLSDQTTGVMIVVVAIKLATAVPDGTTGMVRCAAGCPALFG